MSSGQTSEAEPAIRRERGLPDDGRLFALDFIRAVAIVLVALLHAASPLMYQSGKVPAAVWSIHNLIDSASRIAVPLFFIISGYFVLSSRPSREKEPIRDLRKRFIKIVIPLVIWSVAYHYYAAYVNNKPIDIDYTANVISSMLDGAAVYHLWFLYELIAIYLLIPIMRKLFNGEDRAAIYFVSLWFFMLFCRFIASLEFWRFPLAAYFDLGSAGYLVIGYLLRRHLADPSAPVALLAGVCYFIGTGFISYMTEKYSLAAGSYVEAFHVYNTPLVAVMAVSAFIFLLYVGNQLSVRIGAKTRYVIQNLAACSFGIYFMHVHFLERWHYNIIGESSNGAVNAVVVVAATAIAAIISSWVITFCLRLSKVTRWLAP